MFNFSAKTDKGFTLLEMVISIGIFSVIVVSAIGIMLQVSNVQSKANNLQTVLDNIRFSLELITKEMRTGNSYVLSTACGIAGEEINFKTSIGEDHTYFLDESAGMIMRATEPITGADCNGNTGKVLPFTSPDVLIQKLNFAARGNNIGPDDGQPWITIDMKVKSRSVKYELDTSMDLQTSIVQRFRDIQ